MRPLSPTRLHPGSMAGWVTILLFVAGGIGLGCAFLGSFGQFGLLARTERAVIVFDHPVGGLRPGAAVTFRGVMLGRVEQVSVSADPRQDRARITVTIRVEPDHIHLAGTHRHPTLPSLVQDGLQAELHTASLVTGRIGIDLDIVPGPVPLPHPGLSEPVEIPSHESRLEILRRTLTSLPIHKLAREWQQTVRDGRHTAQQLQTTLPPISSSLTDLTASTHSAVTAMTAARRQIAEDGRRTQSAIARLRTTADQQRHHRGGDIRTVAHNAETALSAAQQVQSDLRAPDNGLKTDITATGRDLTASGAALRDAARKIRRAPTVLLTGSRR